MKKLLLTGTLLCASSAGLALTDWEEEDQSFSHQPLPLGDPRTDCPDFSGTWVGSCSYDNPEKEDKAVEITVDQIACSNIKINDQSYYKTIGSMMNKSVSTAQGVLHRRGSLWWENNGLGFNNQKSLVVFGEVYKEGRRTGRLKATATGAELSVNGYYYSKDKETLEANESYFDKTCNLTRSE